jgi:hypothetical protein
MNLSQQTLVVAAVTVASCGGEPAPVADAPTVVVVPSAASAPSNAIAILPEEDAAPPPSAAPAPPADPSVPTLVAHKLDPADVITIDGLMSESAWSLASTTGPLVDVANGKPNTTLPVNALVRLAWDDRNLYVFWHVDDADVLGGFTNARAQPNDFTAAGQPKLWTKECVELMIDPDGDGDNRDYYELEINPQNKVFHSQYDALGVPRREPNGPFGHEEWNPKLRSAVVVYGTLDHPGDRDRGYNVEMAVPWAAFTKARAHPPTRGDTWRVNFYAMKFNSGVAWSPILGRGNFHRTSRFGRVTWERHEP